MADVQSLTPYFLGLLATAVAWLFKSVIQQGKDTVALQTAFRYYIESRAQGAAKVLDSPNPTPPEMRQLLRRYYEGKATEAENEELRHWLKSLIDNPESRRSERSAALDILTAMGTMKILTRHAHGPS
jgi:hypothetical protein